MSTAMTEDYKPGTVALVNGRRCMLTTTGEWGHGDAHAWVHVDSADLDVRPLVVLDIDFPRTVAKHLRAAYNQHPELTTLGWLADQIEDQTRPPRPKEPSGKGAVVEDSSGVLWAAHGDGSWACLADGSHRRLPWPGIEAVRVLFCGEVDRP